MKTSYFGRIGSKNFRGREMNLVSIARSAKYYHGRTYPPLFPTWDMIRMEDKEEYEKAYRAQVLDKLDPLQVWEDLGEDAVLLCHESIAKIESGETFCHRHMVARWLEEELKAQYDIEVSIPELKDEKEELQLMLKGFKDYLGK